MRLPVKALTIRVATAKPELTALVAAGPFVLARTGGIVALAILVTVFAFLNLSQVKVNWILGSGHAPLIVVIVISLLVGIVLTYAAERIIHKEK